MLAPDAPSRPGDDRDPALAQLRHVRLLVRRIVASSTAATGRCQPRVCRRPVRPRNPRVHGKPSDGAGRSLPGVSVADVLVVGAGPAGVAAAVTLAAAGRDVTMIDKAVFPRDKCCGDGLTTLALRELETLGFDPARSPTGSRSTAPSCARRRARGHGAAAGRAGDLRRRRPPPPARRRPRRDRRQGRRHRRHGGRVRRRARRARRPRGRRRRPAATRSAPATSSPPTGCGARSARPPASPQPGYLGEWHAFRQYGAGVTGSARDHLHVWFEPDCSRVTPGRSRSPAVASTSASASCATASAGSRT